MNLFKRFFALFLTLCMVFSLVPVSAFAAETGDDETAAPAGDGSVILAPDSGEDVITPGDSQLTVEGDTVTTAVNALAGGTNAGQPFPLSYMNGGHYRIPALVTLSDGTLVAAADARWKVYSTPDDCGDIDTMVSYSNDNGANWTYLLANYDGTDNTAAVSNYSNANSATYIDPALAVAKVDGTETIFMIADLFPGMASLSGNSIVMCSAGTGLDDNGCLKLRNGVDATSYDYYLSAGRIYDYSTNTDQGYTVDGEFNFVKDDDSTVTGNLFIYNNASGFHPQMTSYLVLTTSTDGGKTWSDPVMLNNQVKNSNETFYGACPGRGLVTSDGTIMFTAYTYPSQYASVFYSRDGGATWSRTGNITSSTWSSETQLVELEDGTIRAFFRNGNGQICYADGTKQTDGTYSWGEYVATGVSNQSNCMISAIKYSRTYNGQEVILVSCPSSTSARQYGKIFTFAVGEDNAMTKLSEYSISTTDNNFSYSCMTEQADGSIGILYEVGDSGSITYENLSIAAVTNNLPLDEDTNIFVDGADNSNSVAVTVVESSGVTHIHTESTTVASLTDLYVAYNIVCCTDAEADCTAGINCTSTYTTGKATVSIPLGDKFDEDAELKGFVVNPDGSITDIFLVERDTQLDKLSFEVPHFSVVGVTLVDDDDIVYTSEVDLTVKVGQTVTITNDTGNYNEVFGLDTSVVDVTVAGKDTTVYTRGDRVNPTESDGQVTGIDSGEEYLIVTYHNNKPLSSESYNDGGTQLKIGDADTVDPEELWTFTASGSSYQISQGTKYLNLGDTRASTGTTAQDLTVGVGNQANTWSIAYADGDTNRYLKNNSGGGVYATTYTGRDDGSSWYLYKAVANTVGTTDITITGKSADVTSVVVGTTKYNITVVDEAVEITLGVGETKTETLTGVAANGDNSADADSAAIATVSWAGTAVATVLNGGTEVSLESCLFTFTASGDNYVISGTTSDGTAVYLNHYSTATNEIPLTTESNTVAISAGTGDQAGMFRLISQVDSTSSQGSSARTLHFHMEATTPYWNRCGNASHAECHEYLYRPVQAGETSSTEIPGYVRITTVDEIQNGGQYLIAAKNNAGNWYVLNPANSTTKEDYVAQVSGETTTITIKGVNPGETRVDVGGTIYKITVTGDVVDVHLYRGQTKTFTDTTGDHAASYTGEGLNTSVATVGVVGSVIPGSVTKGDQVTTDATIAEGVYLLYNGRGSKYAQSVISGNKLTQSANVDIGTAWIIKAVDGGYTIQAAGGDNKDKFISVPANNQATLTSDLTVLTLVTNGDNWLIGQEINGVTYFLNDQDSSTTLGGWAGSNNSYDDAIVDTGSHWQIFKATVVPDAPTTEITIEGISEGGTSVVVGDTRYNITVEEHVVDVDLYVGQTKTFTIEGESHTTGDIDDSSIATLDSVNGVDVPADKQLVEITSLDQIVSGKSYLIATASVDGNDTALLLTDEAISDTTLSISGNASTDSLELWTFTGSNGTYTISQNGKYLNIDSDVVTMSDTAQDLTVSWATGAADDYGNVHSGWSIGNTSGDTPYYVNNYNLSGTTAGEWNELDTGSIWRIYEIVESEGDKHTEVTFTGKAVGNTTAFVGYTKYNITVEKLVVDVTVKVGETVTHTIQGEAYSDTDTDVTTRPDASKVNMTVTPHAQANWNNPVTQIRSGAKYLIVVNNRTAGDNATDNVLTPDAAAGTNYLALSGDYETSNVYWIIEEVPGEDDTYYVKTADGNYLTIGSGSAGTVAGETKLTLKYTATDSGGYWMLGQGSQYLNQYGGVGNDYAAGYGSQTDTNSQWELFEYIEEDYTDVTFSGLTKGDTTAVVGYTNYNIHVVENVVDVSLYVGETVTETINGVSYTGSNAAEDSWNIASVSWADGSERTVTAELLDTSGTATGTIDLAAAEYTFTRNDDGTYTILDSTGAYYLNVSGIPHGTTETALDLTMNSDGTVYFNVSGDTTMYLCVYRSGEYSMCWTSGKALADYPDDCAFYIYAPVAAGEASSAEIPGYKKVTSLDEITSGEGYLIAFEGADGNVYCVCFTSTGTSAYNNMARIETELVSTATTVTITGRNVGNTSVDVGGTIYNITVLPHVKTLTIEVDTSVTTPVTGTVTDDDIAAFNTAHGSTVTVTLDGDNLVFNGVTVGKAEYVLGNRKYIISVTPVLADTDDSDYLGASGTQGADQVITGLIISTNTSYDLNVDTTDITGEITWESSDTSIFTVNADGTVTTTGTAGEAYVTVKVGGEVYQTIPVKVLAVNNDDTDNLRTIDVYNEEVINCTAYYSYQSGALAEFPQGYQIYIKHNKSETDLITFFATPNDGYALTYIYDTAGTYFHTVSNENHSDYTTDGTHSDSLGMVTGGYQSLHDQLIGYAVNNAGAATADQVHAMLAEAVLYRVDGAFFHSYAVNNSGVAANTHFIAEKLPEVTKTINGVLGASGMQVDWEPYQDGMYAEVGEYIYFTINITIDAPIEWEVDSSGNPVTDDDGYPLAALEYNFSEGDPDAMLIDNLEGAYFYTKELDGQDGDQSGNGVANDDGYIADPSLQYTQQDVTAEMNRGWTAEEIAAGKRVLEYYVVYKIQPEDEGTPIVNTVDLSYIYRTTYSYGATQAIGHAEASMSILGQPMGDIVVDFGLPVSITGLNPGHLAHQFDEAATNAAAGGCKYGYVTITHNEDGTSYTVTYTPTEVFQGYDVVYLMGADGNLKNYFRVRPASTVYYEESFAEFTDGSADTGWTGEDAAVTGVQEFQEPVDTDKNNFGFDGKYADETGMSNGTAAVSPSGAIGNTATFTFTGSGFDLYANTDTTTGVVSVLLYRVTGTDDEQTETLTKFYQVVTANKNGGTTATDGQEVATNSLPIVSDTDLEHGTYKVVIKPSRSGGEFRLDGFRVYNTLADSDAYYPVDEQNVTFTELRDMELGTATLTETSTVDQVYQDLFADMEEDKKPNVIYLSDSYDANDLLENGPKNELWLSDSETLAFTLGTGVNYAQLGLKAPNGVVTCVVTTTYGDKTETATYTITSSTDMFYDIPSYTTSTTETTTGDDGSTTVTTTDVKTVSGATVTVQVTSGMLSVTKLKTSASAATTTVTTTTTGGGTDTTSTTTNIPAYSGPVFASALSQTGEEQIAMVLNVLYGTDGTTDDGTTDDGTTDDGTTDDGTTDDGTTDDGTTDDGTTDDGTNNDGTTDDGTTDDGTNNDGTGEDVSVVTRIYGDNRFETAIEVAEEMRAVLGLEKFDTIILASGSDFADALSGSYLAAKKSAPILLTYNDTYNARAVEYIKDHLVENGTVYILGGTAAVPESVDTMLKDYNVVRLAGENRFETNILILKEAGTHVDQAMLVCTGTNFADSLSASATGAPILLVWNESGELLDCQKEYLAERAKETGARYRIVGGNDAVSREMEKLFQSYGTTERIYGENRFETSAALAELYFGDKVENAVLAYAWNYPDGLCGGPLAHAWGAPLILTMTGYEDAAVAYATKSGITSGIVLGGEGLISDEAVRDIYAMDADGEITVK